MSSFDVLKVHHTVSDRDSGETRVTKITPYIRLTTEGRSTPLFLKGGKVMDENGVLSDPIPSWIWMEASKCSSAALQEAGFALDEVQSNWADQSSVDQGDGDAQDPSVQDPEPPKAVLPKRYGNRGKR